VPSPNAAGEDKKRDVDDAVEGLDASELPLLVCCGYGHLADPLVGALLFAPEKRDDCG
jgi:hypothetical protein